jgi:two-component system sensor histidine kinase SenX3
VTAKVDDLLLSATEGRGTQRSLDIPGPPAKSLTVTAAPLDDKWRTVGGVLVLGDQSEQQHQEGVRRDFVANISHELKTPVGALALLAETLSTEHDLVVVNRLARRVQVEAKRVERVVDDLIDLSRLQSEEDPVRERVAVHLIVAQAAERVRHLAQDKEMTINFGEPPQRLWVMGDRRQLVAAVYNLLENAVKFSPAGSLVEVRGRPGRDDDTGEADGMVEISVRDEGIGIPERDHDRIFERFYRVESTRSATAGGTGLGLSIVRHVVANHDGSVEVDSEEGLGATFTLRLPSAPGVGLAVAPPPPGAADDKALRTFS